MIEIRRFNASPRGVNEQSNLDDPDILNKTVLALSTAGVIANKVKPV
jgi:hypothetical protein